MALEFNINGNILVIDCSNEGGRIMTWSKFTTGNTPVLAIELETDPYLENRLFKNALTLVGCKYDMNAYKYGILRGILKKYFSIPLPKKNKWSDPDKFACNEIFIPIAFILYHEFGLRFDDIDLAMQSPYMLYKRLQGYADEIS
jgi:hypothetical protein